MVVFVHVVDQLPKHYLQNIRFLFPGINDILFLITE